MKTCILFIGIAWCLTWNVVAQPCKQITVDEATQRNVLTKYIMESVRANYFVNDKGVVVVNRFFNEKGRPSWLIRITIDDSYKDNPPVEWANFDRDVILFYDTKSSRFDVVIHKTTPELLHCLDEAIGDRLYIRPPKRDRWIEVPGVNGQTHRVNARRIFAGGSGDSQVITFESDGSVTILQSI